MYINEHTGNVSADYN